MRGQSTHVHYKKIKWSTLKKLIPYLLHYKQRIAFAILCLVLAKIASVSLPFILKNIVDYLNQNHSVLLILPISLLVAYGFVRLSNILFSEIRDTIFGRVTESAMRQIGLKVFKHLHSLDLDFHVNRKTGGLSRDI